MKILATTLSKGWMFSLVCLYSQITFAQESNTKTVSGYIYDQSRQAIIGANISAPYSKVNSQTDINGYFEIQILDTIQDINIDYLGLQSESIISNNIKDTIFLKKSSETLEGVVINKRRKSTETNLFDPIKSENIGLKELAKAACCNLSESFETTPSVDAGFTDAVSGYKQISMLGLSGPNVAFTRENVPDIRGLAAITGLTFTPGPWVESIQLSKGTGSVVNGFEGVAGQINVELLKHKEMENTRLLLNAYQSGQGRSELNAVLNQEINHDWNTSIYAHVKSNWLKVDQNNDSYLDQPLGNTALLGNRWIHMSHNGFEVQMGWKLTYMDLWGGEKDYNKEALHSNTTPWGFNTITKRADVWAKIGKVYLDKPWKSMGLQVSGGLHDQITQYGLTKYDATQKSLYLNYIYQSMINNTNHVIKFGASVQMDEYKENILNRNFNRNEVVPGVFSEYTYKWLDKFTLVAGLRGDYNNLYGAFATPRLHLRYALTDYTALRGSIGRAQRTVNIFSENIGLLASSRTFELENINNTNAYGLNPEVAWNMGINLTHKFIWNYRDGTFSVDYYYTDFQNMIISDIENYQQVKFYNLNGKSYAHSFQAQLDYEIIRHLDVRLAYRYYDVKVDYENQGLLQKPLLSKNRFFINVAYETNNNWLFDMTANWMGSKRLPQHLMHNTHLKSSSMTDDYWLLSGQISKSWKEDKYKLYVGVENILGDMQMDLILNGNTPYGNGFDASLVWGNAMGRNIYLGFNYKLR